MYCIKTKRGKFVKKTLILFIVLSLLVATVFDAFARDIENALFRDLSECSVVVKRITGNSQSGSITPDDLVRLKKCAETLQADRLLFAERQGSLAERAATLGGKAPDRQDNVSSVLLRNLDELLLHLDATNTTLSDLETVQRLLNLLVTKRSRPLLGALPYKHTNYSPREPVSSPLVKPAYKGGDRNVYAADSAASPEAPLSKEIAELAQSLQWNPVLMYEWVKNNVETEWYWGSMKGAEETLRQKSGNDADQASLLVALLRAAKFPARYVRGTIDFFPGIERAKDMTGLDDTTKIAAFFQKAGIPYKPIISGGAISNFYLEHVWVEAFIPYANYRGAVVDDQGKIWLGMDTSIKPRGYTRTPGGGVSSAALSALRDDYLNTVQTLSPLDYLTGKLDEQLSISQPGKSWQDLKDTAVLIPDVLKIIPDSMQFNQIAITGEYQNLPDELKHKLTFTATAGGNELFSITLETLKLSNSKIALRAEPETVEDQNTIDSFGGLDNTPAYLVRLRPVLTLDGERLIVAQDGLPMGADFSLNIDIVTPNGTERISSSQINGNLSVIGVVADKAQTPAAITEADDAETILHKEAIGYIYRWNKGEDDLAQLLGQRISRPAVTIATVGGQMAVTTLLDITHDMEWKGLYLDAGYRRIETTGRNGQENEFMQLSALQGSVLEHRIFEDDLKVDSVSTAKLLQLAKASGTSILTIDKSSINAILPTLSYDDNVKADITNAVNQNLTVTIPQNEIVYRDWSGIGYIKENPETGESGWMLSGQIAGSTTAAIEWVNEYLKGTLQNPNSTPSADPPAKILMIPATNYQTGTVGEELDQKLAVLVLDKNDRPVRNAKVTFSVLTGGGTIKVPSVQSLANGIAAVDVVLGTSTFANSVYVNFTDNGAEEVTQAGLNHFTASLETGAGTIPMTGEFSAYGIPDTPIKILRVFGNGSNSMVGNPAGSLVAAPVDQYNNPVSDVLLHFGTTAPAVDSQTTPPYSLPVDVRNVTFYLQSGCSIPYPIYGECVTKDAMDLKSGVKGAAVNTILGDTINTKYTVLVSAPAYPDVPAAEFTLFSTGKRANNVYVPPAVVSSYLEYFTPEGYKVNAAPVGKQLTAPLTAEVMLLRDDYRMEGPLTCAGNTSCWHIVPSGKTLVTKISGANVVFKTTKGSGTLSSTSDLGNGKYQASFTAGAIPEINAVGIDGTASITIPEVYYNRLLDESVLYGYPDSTLKQRTLTIPLNKAVVLVGAGFGNDPEIVTQDMPRPNDMTVYAVRATLQPLPLVSIDQNGVSQNDVIVNYLIEPPEYNASSAHIEYYTNGDITYDIPVNTQGSGELTLLKGKELSPLNSYDLTYVLNYGSNIEIRSDKMPLQLAQIALIADYDHNRTIDQSDMDRATKGDTFYFWVNDDTDAGETEGDDIPGSSTLNGKDEKVNGMRDLEDFFPVQLNIRDLLQKFPPDSYNYKLKQADSALNFAFACLNPSESGTYLTDASEGGVAKSLADKATIQITQDGVILNAHPNARQFLQNILLNNKGVILLEGRERTSKPLVLEVIDTNNGGKLVHTSSLNLSIAGVEQMFRHVNLIPTIDNPNAPAIETGAIGEHKAKGGEKSRITVPQNLPDSETVEKYIVMLHGFNNDGQVARGWHTEMFKRLYWSGSRAKFVGVSWYGFEDIPNYQQNVVNAFMTAAQFGQNIVKATGNAPVTILAHSLGNMVASSYLSDYHQALPAEQRPNIINYFMLNAAVALEAYLGDYKQYTEGKQNEPFDSTNEMVHTDWYGYQKRLAASEWYRLFVGTEVQRQKLTWRNRFGEMPININYYSYYSTGEDVLGTHTGVAGLFEAATNALFNGGRYAWAFQEKWKGRALSNGLGGTTTMGWGFNRTDPIYNPQNSPDTTTMYGNLNEVTANSTVSDVMIKNKPFFNISIPVLVPQTLFDEGFNEDLQQNFALSRLLGRAIPALTLPVGGKKGGDVITNGFIKESNTTDMNDSANKNGWPSSRGNDGDFNWKHSDIKVVPYTYTYKIFDMLTH